jgi:pyrroloquinoline quinone biosynthesis protein B
MAEFLRANGPWDQLVRYENIVIRTMKADSASILNARLSVTPFLVPHRDEYSETVGFRIEGPRKSVIFIPDINKWELLDERGVSIESLIQDVDVAFLDATFYSGSEVGGRDMSEFPHPFIVESMDRFRDLDADIRSRIYFIHLNHTNPAIVPDSPERIQIERRGFHVADEGMCLEL